MLLRPMLSDKYYDFVTAPEGKVHSLAAGLMSLWKLGLGWERINSSMINFSMPLNSLAADLGKSEALDGYNAENIG
ncbi:acyl:coa ligase acetate-coa synthetase-like protein [Corchorus olitorius]|uniref:Acyl:coa ligase acetate-coa synthetase-like protein n=1 Tax=Corchorus olitorius TaxID=93759 RepID=A0A1R3H8Z4_9ROSI|nr:acyl:coa ligase acetate-coa synthetase-like protein [Corchorus olitorius]